VARFVTDAATVVIGTITTAARTGQEALEASTNQAITKANSAVEAVNAATTATFNDMRTTADRARTQLQSGADRAVEDFQNLIKGAPTPAPEMKHLTNLVKMVAYRAESELASALAPHYRRVEDEGRTLIPAALLSAADLHVTEQELRVTLLPQSLPHRTRAMAALCDELNALNTRLPGSRLRLRYAIHTAS